MAQYGLFRLVLEVGIHFWIMAAWLTSNSLWNSFSLLHSGLALRGGSSGFSPAAMNVPPSPPATFIGKYITCGRKIESKEIFSCLIPRLPVVFTWQLEILLTALAFYSCSYLWKTDTIIFADLNKSPRPQTLLKMRLK